jgi:DNA-binding Xre family transcriptional regulator
MDCSYNKLFKILIDRRMNKKELAAAAGISPSSLAKLWRNENVNVDILIKICRALDCKVDDILDILPQQEEGNGNQLK